MKAKTLILSIALSLFAVSGLLAQDKFEYAIVAVRGLKIAVTTSNEVQTYAVGKGDFDVELLKKVEELNQQGWEVYNTTLVAVSGSSIGGHVFYLRKKKN